LNERFSAFAAVICGEGGKAMMIRRIGEIAWPRDRYGRVAASLIALYLAVSAVSLLIGHFALGYRPSGPDNPLIFAYRLLFPSSAADSWDVMIAALHDLKSGAGSQLYEHIFFDQGLKFQYPPSSLLPLDLIGRFTVLTPRLLNSVNSIVLITLFLGVLWLIMGADQRKAARRAITTGQGLRDLLPAILLAVVAIVTFYPVTRGLRLGQIQIWIDSLFVWSCICFLADRKLLAGVMIGLACTLKPQLGLFLIWALAWKEYRLCLGFLIAFVPLEALAVLLYGMHNHLEYLAVLSFISAHGEVFYANQSFSGLFDRLLGNGNSLAWDAHQFAPLNPAVHLVTMLSGAIFSLLPAALAFWLRRPANVLDLGIAALCFTIASPIAWEHHYGISLPLFILAAQSLWRHAPSTWRSSQLVALGLAWCLMANFMPWLNVTATSGANILQSYVLFGALALLAVTLTEVIALPSYAVRGSAGGSSSPMARLVRRPAYRLGFGRWFL
jgi:alpha-1,2-mannosyltransferase